MQLLLVALRREPAAIGTLLASILPALVLSGLLRLDEQGIAAAVVAVNACVAFAVRLTVTPTAGVPSPAIATPIGGIS